MKKLKIKLLYSLFLVIIILIVIFNFFTSQNKSKYKLNENKFIIKVTDFTIDGDRLTYYGKGKENIIGFYYIKTKQEKKDLLKNLKLGDYLFINGELSIPNNNQNFYLFNYRKYLLSKKIKRIINTNEIKIKFKNKNILYKIKNGIIKYIDKIPNNEYIYLFILGKNKLDNEMKSIYSANGISHLFAISGMHITLITLLISKILKIFTKNKIINLLIIALFLFYFIFLTNFQPSIIRASFLYIFINIKNILNLKLNNLFILFNIFIILLLINPYYLYHLGFLFSFSISFALIYFSDLISGNYLKKIIKTSAISFLTSIPILIYNFHEINLLSIIFNIFFVPFVSLVVFPLGLITFLIPKTINILTIIIMILEKIAKVCFKIKIFTLVFKHPPLILIIIYYFIIFLTLRYIRYKKSFLIGFIIILICHYNINYFDIHNTVSSINVGQGDSFLLKFHHNKGNILIDTGGKVKYSKEKWQKRESNSLTNSTIIPYLKAEGIKKLNYLILSHGDYDHMGEAINLVNNFKVENVIFNIDDYNELEIELIKVLEKKNIKYYKGLKELNVDNNKLYFLNTKEYSNENDNSNVLYFKLNNYKFLFMGDAGVDREKDILDKYNLTDIDFIKIGHHGSNTSSSEYFIDSIKPKNCLISVGKNNIYGHPKESVLDILDDYCDIYRTDINGSIEIKINKNNYKIKNYSS